MKDKKTETFTYEGLGFPVNLIGVPMRRILGEWVLDMNMSKFQLFIFNELIYKSSRLTGKEMKFMRKFLEISTTELGEKLGVTHVAILKWEKETTQISPSQEIYLRMVFLENLKNKELLKVFEEIKPEMLAKTKTQQSVFSVDVKDLGFVA